VSEFDPVDLSQDPQLAAARERLRGLVRVAITVAARAAEQSAHRRAEMARVAETWGGEHARQVRAQLSGEMAAVKVELRATQHPEWWQDAKPEQMAHAWATARSYSEVDPELAGTARWLGSEIERRTGVAPEELWQKVETEAVAERETQRVAAEAAAEAAREAALIEQETVRHEDVFVPEHLRQDLGMEDPEQTRKQEAGRRAEEAAAVVLVADADATDVSAAPRGTERVPEGQPHVPSVDELMAGWDTPQRRNGMAERMESAGVSEEAVEARLLADRGAASPPSAAAQSMQGGRKQPRKRLQSVGKSAERDRGR
jgi:hypothetical protein